MTSNRATESLIDSLDDLILLVDANAYRRGWSLGFLIGTGACCCGYLLGLVASWVL